MPSERIENCFGSIWLIREGKAGCLNRERNYFMFEKYMHRSVLPIDVLQRMAPITKHIDSIIGPKVKNVWRM